MKNSQAVLLISNRNVYFRLNRVPPQLFYRYLHILRKRLPQMYWDRKIGMWQLPIWELKALYETCRFLFGVDNVLLSYQNYTRKLLYIQPRLPGMED